MPDASDDASPGNGPSRPDSAHPKIRDPRAREFVLRHWRANLRITLTLLVLWALAGLGCGVIFAEKLNAVRIGGFPLGFWFAQQGSIAVFVVLILVYAVLVNRLDERLRRDLDDLPPDHPGK